MRAARSRKLLVLPLLALLPSSLLAQQEVRGTVLADDSGAPVVGAMVVLLDAAERVAGSVLTAEDGSFRVAVPAPGRYRLRVDRIGFGSTFGEPFDVPAGGVVRRTVRAAIRPVELVGLDVGGSRRCEVRPAEGAVTARVWEEARKALAAAAWTAEREMYRFAWMRYLRELDPSGRRVLSEERTRRSQFTPSPFVSVDPDVLADQGFVRDSGGQTFYHGPDARVLLSDAFLDTHCLALTDKVEDGARLVGLRFEPIPRRGVPEIEGVVWLEEEGARLRSVEYRYVNLRRRLDGDEASGEITFRELPNGTWVVQTWRIRMPRLAQKRGAADFQVLGYREEGGAVSRIARSSGEIVTEGEGGGTLRGTVTDSLGRAAPGVRVRLVGTQLEALTDATGGFSFEGIGSGIWALDASHPALEAIGHTESLEVDVPGSGVRDVRVELPSVHRVALERCRETPVALDEAVVIGRVLDETGRAAAGAEVRAGWTSYSESGLTDRFVASEEEVAAMADSAGVYVLCGVPTDETVRVWATVGERRSAPVEQWIGKGDEVVAVEVVLGPAGGGPPVPASPVPDTARAAPARRPGDGASPPDPLLSRHGETATADPALAATRSRRS